VVNQAVGKVYYLQTDHLGSTTFGCLVSDGDTETQQHYCFVIIDLVRYISKYKIIENTIVK
jgi:hypothetical protein